MSSTIIDSLIVELGLDPTKFDRGQKVAVGSLRKLEQESKKSSEQIQRHVQGGMEQSFAALQKRMLAVAGLFLGGLGVEQFIQKVTKLNTALANTAGTLGVQAGTLRAYQQAAERFGLNGDAVTQGFGAITQQRSTFINTRTPGGLQRFQYNVNAGAGRTRNPLSITNPDQSLMADEDVTRRLSRWLEIETKAGRGVTGQAALRDIAGLPQEFVQFLAKGPKEIERVLAETKKLAPSNDDIAKFQKLNESFASMSQNAEAAGRKIAVQLVPALVKLTDWASKLFEAISHPFGMNDKEKVDQLNRNRPGGQRYLEEQIARKEAELKATTDNLSTAKGLYRKPLEDQQKELTAEIKKLREELQKQNSGLQKSGFLGGFNQNNVIPAMFSGGGAGGGFGGGTNRSGTPAPGPVDNSPLPEVPGGVVDRSKFAEELKKKPWLRAKIMRIAANEQGSNPLGTQAIIESMMNRAAMRGTSLEAQARWHRSEGGYYDEGNMGRGALENARTRAILEHSLAGALAGSNVADYATDNSSGGLAASEIANGRFTFHKRIHGESFFSPGSAGGRSGPASRAAYMTWRRRIAEEAKRHASPVAGGVPLPRPHPLGSNEHAQLIDGARFASMVGGGSTRSYDQSMSVGDVHIHTAATDARGIASTIRPAIERFARVTSANNGPA